MKPAVANTAMHNPAELKSIEMEKPAAGGTFGARLKQMAAETRRPRPGLLAEFLRLKRGPGKLSFDEYAGLRLYDNALYGDTDKRAFVGTAALRDIIVKVNYRFDFYGVANNKILSDLLFGTYGFPIMPSLAIFREKAGRPSPFLLRDDHELSGFLTNTRNYPLFGKPMNEHQSHGTASLARYDAANHRLITTMSHGIPVNAFISYVKSHAALGYVFQRRVSPHAAIRAVCGERLATLRLITVFTKGQAKLLRACWKIPAGIHIADNFWRPGNLLAGLDYESGKVARAIRSKPGSFEEVARHPDTGARLIGMQIPFWEEAVRLVTEAACIIEEMALIGWDIAITDAGPIIVEINETPDFKLHQLADRRGMLTPEFMGFIEERKQHAAQWLERTRQKKRVITELVPPPAGSSSGA